jgi:hypothetical protein
MWSVVGRGETVGGMMDLPKGVPASEFAFWFIGRMINAMGLSFFKYGPVADAKGVDKIASLKVRLQKYEDTGNSDFLVDVANFAMIESMHPQHPKAHYEPKDSGGPGRVWTNGHIGETANTVGY